MNEKKLYIWRLARFLCQNDKTMSGQELAAHLNRNGIKTNDDTKYEGKRGTYKLITTVWGWICNDLGLQEEAELIRKAFVNAEGLYVYDE